MPGSRFLFIGQEDEPFHKSEGQFTHGDICEPDMPADRRLEEGVVVVRQTPDPL